MTVKFTNNASTTVATGINTTATSLVVASAAGFPTLSGSGDYCYLTIQQAAGTNVEVVKATALSSNTFTIVRAQDGTSAGSWSVSDVVELRVTAALLTDIVDAATHDASVLSVDSTNNRVGVNDTTPSVTLDISGTDAIALPVGTTAQRPSAGAGRFRYNSSLSQFEGYTDAWGAIGGGGTNTFTTDTFTANGSLVAFNLSQTVASANNLLCFIDGVFQTQDAYSIATASGTTTLTFSAAPANARKIVVYSVAAGISGTNLNVDSMTGDGSDVTLTLTINTIKENTQVFIDGVYQAKANYSISGTTLTFSTAPPAGSAVECVTMTQTEINVPVDNTITSAKLSGALTTPAALTVAGALAANGGAVFNEGGADVDFRVESDINANGLVLLGDTGHVGINGSPTAYALEVFDTDGNGIAYKDTTNSVTSFMGAYQSVAITGTLTNHSYALWTNNTERMRIDSSGNVSIGNSSPSALSWPNGSSGGLFLQAGALLSAYNAGTNLSQNWYYNGGEKYIANGSASRYSQNGAEHVWYSAGNNTSGAGAGLSWQERMRIDSSGEVILNAGFQVGELRIHANQIASGYTTDGEDRDLWINYTGYNGGTTRFRDFRVGNGKQGQIVFVDGSAGSLRINGSTGYFGEKFTVTSSTSYTQTSVRTGTGNEGHIVFRNGNGAVGTIFTNGSATAYNTSSDYRLKENVVAMSGATERLKQLNPSRFNFIADADTTVDGFLAHEVQDVVPEAISGTKDAMRDEEYEVTPAVLDDDGNVTTEAVMGTRSVPDYQGIDQSKLVPLLVATIQELEARLTALENN